MADIPVWLTIVVSLATAGFSSSVISAIIASRGRRKEKATDIERESLEKAIAMLRDDYEEAYRAVEDFLSSPDANKGRAHEPTINSIDLQVALLLGSEYLDDEIAEYLKARNAIPFYMRVHPFSPSTRESMNEAIEKSLAEMKIRHDTIVGAQISRRKKLLGIKRRNRRAFILLKLLKSLSRYVIGGWPTRPPPPSDSGTSPRLSRHLPSPRLRRR